MKLLQQHLPLAVATAIAALALTASGCSTAKDSEGGSSAASKSASAPGATLTGTAEAPPVKTDAHGTTDIHAGPDMVVTGTVTTYGVPATMAHIHQGAPGTSGPVIIPLVKVSETTFTVPANTKLTADQYAAYKAGNLYVNVHSKAHPAGEIRAQLAPK